MALCRDTRIMTFWGSGIVRIILKYHILLQPEPYVIQSNDANIWASNQTICITLQTICDATKKCHYLSCNSNYLCYNANYLALQCLRWPEIPVADIKLFASQWSRIARFWQPLKSNLLTWDSTVDTSKREIQGDGGTRPPLRFFYGGQRSLAP